MRLYNRPIYNPFVKIIKDIKSNNLSLESLVNGIEMHFPDSSTLISRMENQSIYFNIECNKNSIDQDSLLDFIDEICEWGWQKKEEPAVNIQSEEKFDIEEFISDCNSTYLIKGHYSIKLYQQNIRFERTKQECNITDFLKLAVVSYYFIQYFNEMGEDYSTLGAPKKS